MTLHMAVENNREALVTALVENNADINVLAALRFYLSVCLVFVSTCFCESVNRGRCQLLSIIGAQ